MDPAGLPSITEAFPVVSVNAILTTVLAGSGHAASFQPGSSSLLEAPDVSAGVSQDATGVDSQLQDVTVTNEPRGGEADPASPEENVREKDGAEAAAVDVMEPGCSREQAVKFSTPPQDVKVVIRLPYRISWSKDGAVSCFFLFNLFLSLLFVVKNVCM